SSPQEDSTANEAEAVDGLVEVLDLEGTPVMVPPPDELDSIVITSYKNAYGAAVLLGQIDKVTGMADTSNFVWLRHAFPQTIDIKDYGKFDEVNVEELLQDAPDVIISPQTASIANENMRDLDLPVVVDGIDVEDSADVFRQSYDEIDLVARLTGTEDVAADYYQWADGLFDLVAERVADIPQEERVTVVPLRGDILEVYGNNGIWGYLVEMAGGVNLSGDITAGMGGKFFAEIDAEQLVDWNPDMMFQINFYGEFDEAAASTANDWSSDARFADLTAFESGNVYLTPEGIGRWNSAIEGPLAVLWMAQIMYPDLFTDIDVKQEAEDFYRTFIDYEMTDEDWELMAPQFTGMNPNGLIS
ncbi:MAG: ABC transporter substrate-binding protein, partial [Beutenbergiaceae bacterium]